MNTNGVEEVLAATLAQKTYRGTSPASGKEIAISTAYIEGLSTLKFFADIHAYGAMWMCPWGYTTNLPSVYNQLVPNMQAARSAIQAVNGNTYAIGSIANVIYVASGSSADWILGRLTQPYAYAIEAAGNSFILPIGDIPRIGTELFHGFRAAWEQMPE